MLENEQAVEAMERTRFYTMVQAPNDSFAQLITGLPEEKVSNARDFAQQVYDRTLSKNPNSMMANLKEFVFERLSILKAAADTVREKGGPVITRDKLNTLKRYSSS